VALLTRASLSACRVRPWTSDLRSKRPLLPQQLSPQLLIQTTALLQLDLQACVEPTQTAALAAICRPHSLLVPPVHAPQAWIGNRSLQLRRNLPCPLATRLAMLLSMLRLMEIWRRCCRGQGGRCKAHANKSHADADAIVILSLSFVYLESCTCVSAVLTIIAFQLSIVA
jgi:hypothetical protein